MSMVKEFKEFAMKGNVVDLAVGLIIGGAFGKIVTSMVTDILMPPIGLLLGGVDFSKLALNISNPLTSQAAVQIRYGLFINTVIDFLVVAFAIFMMIRGLNSVRRKQEAPVALAAPTVKDCPECKMPIPIAASRCGHCTTVLSAK